MLKLAKGAPCVKAGEKSTLCYSWQKELVLRLVKRAPCVKAGKKSSFC